MIARRTITAREWRDAIASLAAGDATLLALWGEPAEVHLVLTRGDQAEILDNLAKVIRERFKLYRHVQTVTAEGRLSLMVLMAIPPIAALLFFITNRAYIMILFTDPLGHMLVGGAIISQTLGYLVIRKVIQIKELMHILTQDTFMAIVSS